MDYMEVMVGLMSPFCVLLYIKYGISVIMLSSSISYTIVEVGYVTVG